MTPDAPLTPEAVREALRRVKYPGFSRDIVSFGIVKEVETAAGTVRLRLHLPGDKPADAEAIEAGVRAALEALPGVRAVEIARTSEPQARRARRERGPIAGVRHIVAVASGKGGVGKTTVAVNLAVALARRGMRVGLLDADIYGPNVPLMLGAGGALHSEGGRILPLERWGVHVMSIGFLLTEESPLIWRGPLVAQAVQQLLRDTRWPELDLLLVDLPPGTGDAQLTLVQSVPLAGAVIVTTPSDVSLQDAEKGLRMFRKVGVPVFGIVENMSYFVCPCCGTETDIFSRGGGRRVAEALGAPFLGELPLDPRTRRGGDTGEPVAAGDPAGPAAAPFFALAALLETALAALPAAAPEAA